MQDAHAREAVRIVRGNEIPHTLLVEHDLFRKPVPTFRDHALDCAPQARADLSADDHAAGYADSEKVYERFVTWETTK